MPHTITRREYAGIPEYEVSGGLHAYRCDSAAAAEYLCWVLNHMTTAQHMDALKRETPKGKRRRAA